MKRDYRILIRQTLSAARWSAVILLVAGGMLLAGRVGVLPLGGSGPEALPWAHSTTISGRECHERTIL